MNAEATSENVELEQWVCTCCGYVYDPEIGDPENGIDPGTSYENLPEDWRCPVCIALKAAFEKL